jgi:hypothetical protein
MEIPKNAKGKDDQPTHDAYWKRLIQADPEEICARSSAGYLTERKGYTLPVLNRNYLILPHEKKILGVQGNSFVEERLRDHFYLMVLLYLLDCQKEEPSRTWISEKDLKGGTTFFRGPHALPVKDLERVFGKDPEAFWQAGLRLGGMELLFGDKAFALTVFPRVPLGYVLWKEDEEFPPRITVMFDSTIQKHFSLDGIWCMVSEVSQRLLEAHGS